MRRRRALHLALLYALACSTSTAAQSDDNYIWEHEDSSQAGLSIYTSDAPDHGYDALRLVATLNVPLSRVFAKLQDFEHYPSWYSNCRRVQVLQRPADATRVEIRDDGIPEALPHGHYALLLVQRVPPLEDRWAILRASTSIAGKTVLIKFQSLDAASQQGPVDGVRMRMRGTWSLTPLSHGRTRVALAIDVDPNVALPAFVVDPELQDIAVKVMQGLQHSLQR